MLSLTKVTCSNAMRICQRRRQRSSPCQCPFPELQTSISACNRRDKCPLRFAIRWQRGRTPFTLTAHVARDAVRRGRSRDLCPHILLKAALFLNYASKRRDRHDVSFMNASSQRCPYCPRSDTGICNAASCKFGRTNPESLCACYCF